MRYRCIEAPRGVRCLVQPCFPPQRKPCPSVRLMRPGYATCAFADSQPRAQRRSYFGKNSAGNGCLVVLRSQRLTPAIHQRLPSQKSSMLSMPRPSTLPSGEELRSAMNLAFVIGFAAGGRLTHIHKFLVAHGYGGGLADGIFADDNEADVGNV